jgi:hypothetical protein
MNEPGLDRRSLTPCQDENDENCCLESSKEIELSDISDIEIEEDENWKECNKINNEERRDGTKSNGNEPKAARESTFKKITRNTRGRNYRDNIRRKPETGNFQHHRQQTHQPYRRFDTKRRDMERYNVRNVVASREFTISRSRSRSPKIDSVGSRGHRSRSFSPKNRENYRRKSVSPAHYGSNRYKSSPRKYSPFSSKHSRSPSLDRYKRYKNSPSPELPSRRSRSRHKAEKIRKFNESFFITYISLKAFSSSGSTEKSSKRKKHKSKDHPRKHKKSRSKSKQHISSSPSISPEPAPSVTSQPRQIMNVPNANLPQENIKVILKNEDAIAKRQKLKKREKKSKKEKLPRKEVAEKTKDILTGKEVSKEVFASGDNILISVCFNNNNNNSNGKSKEDQAASELLTPIKTKSKKRQPSPAVSTVSSTSFEEAERRQRKHKRKKVKNKRERVVSKAPETPPIAQSKRKSDMKPIAIIDLEKSPGKEVTQSPKEVIVLSDSDGDGKKRDNASKDVIIIEDVIIEKNNTAAPAQPVLKFALKSKSNILPFNLLHDQAEEVEEQDGANASSNNDAAKNSQQKDSSEMANSSLEEKSSNQRDAYDPFEPTKSGSTSPVTPPPPNDVSSSSDMMKNKLESPKEKMQTPAKEQPQTLAIGEEHMISSSMWSRKEFDKKQPLTPPLPPTFNMFSGSSTQTAKQHTLYDGIYGNDLKTPVLPSPATKGALKATHDEKNNDDDRTPYSPSSDGYDFEPPPAANNDNHNNDPGSGSSYTFSSADDVQQPKSGPLKLTASTLKTFNSTMRSTGPVGLQFVNKTELNIFENYLPASQQKSGFLRSKISRFTNSLNENGSPAMARGSMNYHETLKPPVIGEF